MWQLDNRTPFAAERTWVRDREGRELWLVAVKCTFDIMPDGTTEVSTEQPPVVQAPEYFGDPAQSSLKYDIDLVRTKKNTDIILHGHAYAPDGKSVKEMEVGFQVGMVTKVLRVFGDRVWNSGLSITFSAPKPFVKMPLVYERAYGGTDSKAKESNKPAWDSRNQLGTGYAVTSVNLEGVALPNIEYPKQLIKHWDDRPSPAGFGPVCNHWQSRAQYAGTYDDKWLQTRMPLLPEDFDERYYQCAPEDQQASQFMEGGEPVVMQNLTPEGDIRFHLPKVQLGFETFFYDGDCWIHPQPSLNTVILEPDYPRVSMVWHTSLPCNDAKGLKLHRTLITQLAEPWSLVKMKSFMNGSPK